MAIEAKDVAVIGGGFAGLAAGVGLSARGFRVALLEGKPALGGRAYSFIDEETGDEVDNGQHVLMGCYRETLRFLEVIGTRDRLIVHPNLEIEMIDGPGHRARLKTAHLPGPLHIAAALLGYGHLTVGERIQSTIGGMRLMTMRRREPERLKRMSVAELMEVLRQSRRARQCFWYPIAIATLNEDPELASAFLFGEVLKRAFFGRRSDSAFVYSRVGLSELYCEAAKEFIEQSGGVVATRAIVEGFDFAEDGTIGAMRLRDGSRLSAMNYVAAVPPRQLLKLLPQRVAEDPFFSQINTLNSSPIVCVHAWFDREVTRASFAGFIGTETQWLFNKRRIFEQHGERHPGYLSFVISGARKLAERSNDEILEQVLGDMHKMMPTSRVAKLNKALVLKEKQATMAPDPLSDRKRPTVTTPIDNLFLAGDWIQTGLPATIESAVAAANAASAAIVSRVEHR